MDHSHHSPGGCLPRFGSNHDGSPSTPGSSASTFAFDSSAMADIGRSLGTPPSARKAAAAKKGISSPTGSGHGRRTTTSGTNPRARQSSGVPSSPATAPGLDAAQHRGLTNDHERSNKKVRPSTSGPEDNMPQIKSNVAFECARQCFQGTRFETYIAATCFEVGLDGVCFWIHDAMLEMRCESYFEALQFQRCPLPRDASGSQTYIALPNDLVSTFRLFLSWVYTGELIPVPSQDRSRPDEDLLASDMARLVGPVGDKAPNDHVHDIDLVRLYNFAEDKKISELSNLVMSELFLQNERRGCTTAKGAIKFLLDHYPSATALYDQLAEEAVSRLKSYNLASDLCDFPHLYANLVFRLVLRGKDTSPVERKTKNDQRRKICNLHNHASAEERAACHKRLLGRTPMSCLGPEEHDLHSDVGVVTIGIEKLRFTIHKKLLGKHSDYFNGAFDAGFIETQRNEINLEHESVKDFALFLRWAYTGWVSLPTMEDYDDYSQYQCELRDALENAAKRQTSGDLLNLSSAMQGLSFGASQTSSFSIQSTADISMSVPSFPARTHQTLVDLFAFADRRGVQKLRNDIINLLAEKREEGWPYLSADPELVETAYSCLPADSALCRFLVDEAVWCWTNDTEGADDLEAYPSEFTAAFVKTMLRHNKNISRARPAWRHDLCQYHDHSTPAERTACSAGLSEWYSRMSMNQQMAAVTFKG